ncbi:MAG: hypothetical protein M3O70_27370 [Actinomycetota bacterium]|nr:hypothetical protein [Actinomycetota bacterium]
MTSTRRRVVECVAAPFLGAALAVGATACGGSAGPTEGTSLEDLQQGDAPAVEGPPADEEDIAEAPNDDTERYLPDQASYLGKEVTVSGTVVEVFNPHAFVIGKGDLATLVTRSNTGLTLQPGTVAQVTGIVGRFALADVERELDADFADDDFVEFERAPYIAAENVNLLN